MVLGFITSKLKENYFNHINVNSILYRCESPHLTPPPVTSNHSSIADVTDPRYYMRGDHTSIKI